MEYFRTWNDAIVTSLQNMWTKVVSYVPELLGALVILIVGLIVASMLGALVKKLINYTHVDRIIARVGLTGKFESIGLHLSIGVVVGWIVKWFFIVVVLMTVVDILHLQQVNLFLQDVALYIPNVIVAVVILVIGLVIGQFTYQVIEKSAQASHLTASSAHVLALLAKWAIIIFSLMASLSQLSIATRLIEILFTGLIAMLALAFGLAFGLGGKDKANKFLADLDQKHL